MDDCRYTGEILANWYCIYIFVSCFYFRSGAGRDDSYNNIMLGPTYIFVRRWDICRACMGGRVMKHSIILDQLIPNNNKDSHVQLNH